MALPISGAVTGPIGRYPAIVVARQARLAKATGRGAYHATGLNHVACKRLTNKSFFVNW
jgi:hypothetical protein